MTAISDIVAPVILAGGFPACSTWPAYCAGPDDPARYLAFGHQDRRIFAAAILRAAERDREAHDLESPVGDRDADELAREVVYTAARFIDAETCQLIGHMWYALTTTANVGTQRAEQFIRSEHDIPDDHPITWSEPIPVTEWQALP